MSMRTIWVSIRAANYSDQATRQVGRNIDELVKKQQQLQRQMTRTFAAGVMYTVMAGMIGMALGKIIGATGEGAVLMNQFERAIHNLTVSLGTELLKILGPTIKSFIGLLNVIANNEPMSRFVALGAILLTTMMAIKGASFLLTAGLAMLTQWWANLTVSMQAFTAYGGYATVTVFTLSGAFQVLKASMGPALMIFMLLYQVATAFGDYAWVLIPIIGVLTAAMAVYAAVTWSAATAFSVLTMGVAAIVGVAAAIAAQASMPTYQQGTNFVRKSGLAFIHEGEQVIPSKYAGKTIKQATAYSKSKTDVTISIGTIKTSADEEQLRPLILKTVNDALRDKR